MMSFQPERRLRNPLMRRLQRHSHISTLFRAPTMPETAAYPNQASQLTWGTTPDSSDIVQATLGGGPELPMAISETHPVSDIQEHRRTAVPQQSSEAFGSAQRPISAAKQPVPIDPGRPVASPRPARALPPASTSRTEQLTAESSQPEADSDSTLTDNVWRRLQTIFKRHQDRPSADQPDSAHDQTTINRENPDIAASEPAASGKPALTPSSAPPSQVTAQAPARVQRTIEIESRIQSEIAQTERPRVEGRVAPDVPVSVPDEVMDAETPSSRDSTEAGQAEKTTPTKRPPSPTTGVSTLPNIVEREATQEITRNEASRAATSPLSLQSSRPAEELASTPPTHLSPHESQVTEIEHEALTQTQGQYSQIRRSEAEMTEPSAPPLIQKRLEEPATTRVDIPEQALPRVTSPSEQVVEDQIEGPTEGTLSLDNEVAQQPIPLQDAWRVERKIPETPPAAHMRRQPPSPVEETNETYQRSIQTSVSRVLENVAAQGPTSSSVELVAPRRPRPVLMRGAESSPRSTIMRTPSVREDSQEAHSAEQIRTTSDEDRIVDTAIGPLPADLWSLIDEQVPAPVRRQSSYAETIQPTRSESRVEESSLTNAEAQASRRSVAPRADEIKRAPPVSSTVMPATERHTLQQNASAEAPTQLTEAPTRIQRVTEQYGGGTQQGEQRSTAELEQASPSQTQDEAPESDESSINIDELALRVYAEVKRKLAIERERLRSRF